MLGNVVPSCTTWKTSLRASVLAISPRRLLLKRHPPTLSFSLSSMADPAGGLCSVGAHLTASLALVPQPPLATCWCFLFWISSIWLAHKVLIAVVVSLYCAKDCLSLDDMGTTSPSGFVCAAQSTSLAVSQTLLCQSALTASPSQSKGLQQPNDWALVWDPPLRHVCSRPSENVIAHGVST